MTLKNISRFHDDESVTTTTYKKYLDTENDKYPTFSVCFEGDGLYRFNGSAIFNAYGINLRDYEMMVQGEQAFQFEYDPSSMRYRKIPLPPKYQPSNDIREEDLFQLPDIVKKASFIGAKQGQNILFGEKERISVVRSSKEQPFYISYQSLKLFCLTRKQGNASDFIRHHDSVVFDMTFRESSTILKIFVHYPGQLLRSFDNPSWTGTLLTGTHLEEILLRISQSTLLRKRSVHSDLCNNNIANHDMYLLESVINDTGCVPPYWKNIIDASSNLDKCRSPKQFKKIHRLTNGYNRILENRESPCLDMFNAASRIENRINSVKICRKCAYVKIVYVDKYYEEIKDEKDFGFEDFISNLGGFIGIFLGYSMLQIPQLLGKYAVF